MKLDIHVEVIPHKQQRYSTIGDWWMSDDGVLQIRASELPKDKYSGLIVLHELVEALVEALNHGDLAPPEFFVEMVDRFDVIFGSDRDDAEPGYSPDAPYFQGHMIASAVEHMVAMILAIDFNDFQGEISRLEW